MKDLLEIVKSHNLLELDHTSLDTLKHQEDLYINFKDCRLYKKSLYLRDKVLYFIARLNNEKSLFLVSKQKFSSQFKENIQKIEKFHIQKVEFNYENSLILKKLFPFTSPISLRNKKTTFGCGDRLGLATPGHIRAAEKFDIYPVLAQQSIRELNLTNRTYNQVTSDVVFLVFQEGFERGYGADGDHLKTFKDIDIALKAEMPMITLDLTEFININVANWNETKIEKEFEKIEMHEKNRIINTYADKVIQAGDNKITISSLDAKRCTLLYIKALNFAQKVDKHLKHHRKENYDLEISIDETTTPTLPSHHLFIIIELIHRKITVNSLAPRFIGDFQKAIDYIGNIAEFEKYFKFHCDIAKNYGNYKISIHSGSDKFSVFPIIGKYSKNHFHLKTAGTSWLQALKCIAKCNPKLFRRIYKKAFEYYNDALKFYHITADISNIRNIDEVEDHNLISYFENDDSRQLFHITYGGLLNDPEIKEDFFNTLNKYEDLHYELVCDHISKHMESLGLKRLL
jgi:hypothetical protein